ncbi:MAG: hypothetical protein FJZ47_11235 [Candidatus Tectomicrobia bacterium]|uniref:Putative restriction endonuclease domain-containing protein n=1 Tax=Tectimicrobiota bacterium TaxID=2528274 RepID=A0A937W327_UNCTE|nr:hypothetical protein [Candidatus Tectomicrobia bacterium]
MAHNRRAVLQKITEYFAAGVQQVWLIDPEARTVMMFHTNTRITVLTADDVLTGGDILPGCPLQEIFAGPGHRQSR